MPVILNKTIGFFLSSCVLENSFAYNYSDLPTAGNCSGTEGAAIFGCLLLSSYLVLVSLVFVFL